MQTSDRPLNSKLNSQVAVILFNKHIHTLKGNQSMLPGVYTLHVVTEKESDIRHK